LLTEPLKFTSFTGKGKGALLPASIALVVKDIAVIALSFISRFNVTLIWKFVLEGNNEVGEMLKYTSLVPLFILIWGEEKVKL
jgi:hypothetical protein